MKWLLLYTKKTNTFVDIFLVDSKVMDKNVLSYPEKASFPRPDRNGVTLGEIYLNPEYIKENKESLLYMLVHGYLHLLGYDHIRKDDRIVMEKEEDLIMSKLTELGISF